MRKTLIITYIILFFCACSEASDPLKKETPTGAKTTSAKKEASPKDNAPTKVLASQTEPVPEKRKNLEKIHAEYQRILLKLDEIAEL